MSAVWNQEVSASQRLCISTIIILICNTAFVRCRVVVRFSGVRYGRFDCNDSCSNGVYTMYLFCYHCCVFVL